MRVSRASSQTTNKTAAAIATRGIARRTPRKTFDTAVLNPARRPSICFCMAVILFRRRENPA
jgi:hypothetical protein